MMVVLFSIFGTCGRDQLLLTVNKQRLCFCAGTSVHMVRYDLAPCDFHMLDAKAPGLAWGPRLLHPVWPLGLGPFKTNTFNGRGARKTNIFNGRGPSD